MSNFNSRRPHSNVTDQTPGVNANGKRSINNLATSAPGVTSALGRTRPRGPNGPPQFGRGIPVQSYSSQVHQMTNNTTSVLLFSKAWKDKRDNQVQPGHMLFAQGGPTRMCAVLNLPQMNEALARSEGGANTDPTWLASPGNCFDGVKLTYENNNTYHYFGVLRNEAVPSKLQKLFNVDVFGRSKIANVFGRTLRRGDRLGLVLVKMDRRLKANGGRETNFAKKWQWVPTVNWMVVPHIDVSARDAGRNRSISIGVVTHAVSEKPSDAHMRRGLQSSDAMTSLPQIEILVV